MTNVMSVDDRAVVLCRKFLLIIMKTILCPVDFSLNSNHAAEYGCAFAASFNAEVILFHAYETPAMITEASFTVIGNANVILRELAEKKLNALQKKLKSKFKKLNIRTEASEGAGYEETVSAAQRLHADLIIMGTTGSGRIERLLMGSTTSRVISRAECPVLCIPKGSKFKGIHKIVFATDLNEDNLSSAVKIAPFANMFGADITFIFVDDKHLMHDEKDIAVMTRKIRNRVKYKKISGYVVNNTGITQGIGHFLKKYPADLLVMFTHHRHFPETLIHQSFTKMMSHQASIPLLTLKLGAGEVV